VALSFYLSFTQTANTALVNARIDPHPVELGRRHSGPWRATGGWPDCVQLDVASAAEVLHHAAMQMAGGLPRVAADFAYRLQARHTRRSTALGRGVALPHADSGYANRLHAVYVRTLQPVVFDAPDGAGVTDFLVLIVPRPASPAYGELLARLSHQLSLPARLQELRHGPVSEAMSALWRRARDG